MFGYWVKAQVSRRYEDPIEVEVNGTNPTAFSWRGRRYPVQRLLKYWRERGEAWDPQRSKDNEFFRVEAEGGTYDLVLDRLAGRKRRWRLARVWD
jgi:hypothetical protein